MPKNTKSSASSATRKKKAQKAAKKDAGQDGESGRPTQPPPQRGQKKAKGKDKEPRKKVYIPPTKPKQDTIDPLDALGLAALLPSDLVVLLRKAGKKDVVTRSRALEGILDWMHASDEEERDDALVLALPCWAHLFPRLSVSPNRRLRQLTSQINALMLASKTIFAELLVQPECLEAIICSMLILAFDPDRQVARIAKMAWEQHTDWHSGGNINLDDQLELLLSHISTIIFHQSDDSTPMNSVAALHTSRDAKNRDDVNVEEDVEGTDARLVYGALGALGWLMSTQPQPAPMDRYEPLMTSPTLWTSLSAKTHPQQRCLGCLSPIVRKAAWQLVCTLAVSWSQLLDKALTSFAHIALQSAFEETDVGVANHMREGLVTLVRSRPEVWKAQEAEDEDGDDHGDDSDEAEDAEQESDDDEGTGQGSPELQEPPSSAFPLYRLFLDWLSSGLRGVHGNYNIVIVLLSTFPSDVCPPSSTSATALLAAFYMPLDERTIEGREALRLFVPAFLECLVWLSGSVCKAGSVQEASLVVRFVESFYKDFVGTLDTHDSAGQEDRVASVGEERLRSEVGALLRKLGNIDVALATPLLDLVRSSLSQSVLHPSHALMDRNIAVLKQATTSTPTGRVALGLQTAIDRLVFDLIVATSNVVASGEAQTEGVRMLSRLLLELPASHESETRPFLELVFTLLCQDKVPLSTVEHVRFLAAYVCSIDAEVERHKRWTMLLDSLLLPEGKVDWVKLGALMVEMKGRERLADGAPLSTLDAAVQAHYIDNVDVVRRLMVRPQPYIRPATVDLLLDGVASQEGKGGLLLLDSWLRNDPGHPVELFKRDSLRKVVPSVARLALLGGDPDALAVWNTIRSQSNAQDVAVAMLGEQLIALEEPLQSVLEAVESLTPHRALMDVLPNKATFSLRFADACAVNVPRTLAILDPLAIHCQGREAPPAYDEAGLTSYGRFTIALLAALEESGIKAAWSLPHLVALALAGEDAAAHSEAGISHFLAGKGAESGRADTVNRAIRLATSILSSSASQLDEAWYANTARILKDSIAENVTDEMQAMLLGVWTTPHSARILARLLKGLVNFSGAGEGEGVHLLRLALATQDATTGGASAIYSAVKELVLESPVYDRIRNELAARLAGTPASKVGSEGIRTLQLLLAAAPPADSSQSLIPQQRCIFLLQTLQRWIASDESDDFPADIHGLLMQVLAHLLPIVQDMSGSHLPFVCDLIDVNLSDGMSDPVCVYHALGLVDLFNSLAERNLTLREVWKESKMDIFEDVHDLFLAHVPSKQADQATLAVEESLANVLQFTPESLFTSEADVGPLVERIRVGASQAQMLAFRLLSASIRERVKVLVVEVAVGGQAEGDGDGAEGETGRHMPLAQVKLSDEVVSLLDQPPLEGSEHAFLLAWLALFEHFEESSLQLKAVYASQVQTLGLVDGSLLPFFFAQTQLQFEPSRWALDEVYLDGEWHGKRREGLPIDSWAPPPLVRDGAIRRGTEGVGCPRLVPLCHPRPEPDPGKLQRTQGPPAVALFAQLSHSAPHAAPVAARVQPPP